MAQSNGKNGQGRTRQGERSAKPDSGTPSRSYGPVPNLESLVPEDWWRRIFNALYLKTDGDVVEDNTLTELEVDAIIRHLDLKPGQHILDLCCGQGRHTIELARRGYAHVEGMDRSHYLVRRARQRAKQRGLAVRFKEGDARNVGHKADDFDVVLILGNSFGYFSNPSDDLRVLREVRRILKPGARLFLDVTDGEFVRANFAARSWEWIDEKHFVCRERSLSEDRQRLISREVITHVEKGVLADQFYAERLYSREGLAQLLREAGFDNISEYGTIDTESKRNQDLGMMEKRILVSAISTKHPKAKVVAKPALRNLAVVQGDPSRPDKVKPSGGFDQSDLDTIKRLQQALEEIGGYRIRYFNRHSTMIQDLKNARGEIDLVLNLCDEGFDNNPRHELHVPAILDILGIAYTGAGPQCLAYCYDKSLVRGIASEMGIPVPPAFFIKPEDSSFDLPFDFPVIVKPNFGDSSVGITQHSVAYTLEQLVNAITRIRETGGYDKPVLVEKFLTGADLTVGIIGNPPTGEHVIYPIVEEDYSQLPEGLPKICGYEAKWDPNSEYWKSLRSIPAQLPEATEAKIEASCLKLFERLECQDYARFDWRLDAEGNPYLLEANPNPGWCWDGHLAKMAAIVDVTYPQMLAAILKAAERRYAARESQAGQQLAAVAQ